MLPKTQRPYYGSRDRRNQIIDRSIGKAAKNAVRRTPAQPPPAQYTCVSPIKINILVSAFYEFVAAHYFFFIK